MAGLRLRGYSAPTPAEPWAGKTRPSIGKQASRCGWPLLQAVTRSSGELIGVHFQRGDKSFLRDLDLAELAHLLFALFLLFEELALAGNVAAVAFRRHVLAQRLDGLARDDFAADRGLHGNLKQV